MATRKRWTTEENNILVQAIKANPHNIKKLADMLQLSLKVEHLELVNFIGIKL